MSLAVIETKVTANTKQHDKAIDKSKKKVTLYGEVTEKATEKARKGFAALGVATTAAMTAATYATIRNGAAFESTMATVGAVSRSTAAEFDDLKKRAEEMGRTTEWSARQSAEALKYMSMAGFTAAQSMEALPGVLNLATAAGMDLGQASDIVTDSLTAMGLGVSDLSNFNDILTGTTTRSNTNIQMMGESLRYAAPIAASMGVDIGTLAAQIGTLANAGIKASDAGTDLRQAMIRNKKAAAELGTGTKDLMGTLEAAVDAGWDVNDVTDKYGMIASKSVLVLMRQIREFKKLKKELANVNGETDELAKKKLDTVTGDFKLLKSAVEAVGLASFENIKGQLREDMQGITTWLQDNNDTVVANLEGISVAIKGIGTAAGWTLGKVAWIPRWVNDISAAMGLVEGGVLTLDDVSAAAGSPDKLHALVEKFDMDPVLTMLQSQEKALKASLSDIEVDLKRFKGLWEQDDVPAGYNYLDKSVIEAAFKEKADVFKKKAAELASVQEQIRKTKADAEEKFQDEVIADAKEHYGKIKAAAVEAAKKLADEKERLRKQAGRAERRQADEDAKALLKKNKKGPVQDAHVKEYEDEMQRRKDLLVKFADEYDQIHLSMSDYGMKQIEKDVKAREDAGADIVQLEEYKAARIKALNKDVADASGKDQKRTIDLWENTSNVIQNSMSDVFGDALRGELTSFEDYFQSFTDSLISMWSQMSSQMVMSNFAKGGFQGIGGMGGMASAGVMGAAGIGLMGVSSILSSRERKKAKAKERRRARDALNAKLDDSIARLDLSDIDYQIHQMNTEFATMQKEACRTGASIEKLNKWRQLETEQIIEQAGAGYRSLSDTIDGHIIDMQREDWTATDWTSEFDSLGTELSLLNNAADNYNDKSLELFKKQYDTLLQIESLQQQQLTSYESTTKSLTSQIWDLTGGSKSGVSSLELSDAHYTEMFLAAQKKDPVTNATGETVGYQYDTQAIAEFQSYVDEWINVKGAAGLTQDAREMAIADLTALNVGVESEMERLTSELMINTDAVGNNTLAIIGQLEELNQSINNEAVAVKHKTWEDGRPAELDGVLNEYGGLSGMHATRDDMSTLIGAEPWNLFDNAIRRVVIGYLDPFIAYIEKEPHTQTWNDWKASGEGWEEYKQKNGLSGPMPSYDVGTPFIPHDQVAKVHQGERILTATENRDIISAIRSMGSRADSGPIHVHVHMDGREIANVVVDQTRKNPQLRAAIKKVA